MEAQFIRQIDGMENADQGMEPIRPGPGNIQVQIEFRRRGNGK
jgi:hypothetical protein